jgi:hypothetical protein
VQLSHKRFRDWTIELPAETFTTIGDGISLAGGRYHFAATMEGSNLALDLDADGTTDVRITGAEGSALLHHEDGFRYAIRLKRDANGWSFAASGAMVGKLGDVRLALIDQDNDGIFGEVGEDALLVGRGRIATWLGSTFLHEGRTMALDFDPASGQLLLSDWQGETGLLSVATGFHGKGKLLSAVVRSLDSAHCFDLAGTEGAVPVPVGRYRIVSGRIGLGESAVTVAAGNSPVFEVRSDAPRELDWGGPVRAEFEFQRPGDELAFAPERVWYFGASGEQYLQWKPVGRSPLFKVIDRSSGQEVARAVFPGSC